MKNFTTMIVLFACLVTFSQTHANTTNTTDTPSQEVAYGHVDGFALKTLIESGLPVLILDARGDKWNDNHTIPDAKLASYKYSPEALAKIIPSKDTLIVVFCYSSTCPLSSRLVKKLILMGYPNVLEYPGGLKEWRDVLKFPVDVLERT